MSSDAADKRGVLSGRAGLLRALYTVTLAALFWVVFDRWLGVDLTRLAADAITTTGAEWVMYLLMALSVLAGGVALERWRFYARRSVDGDAAQRRLERLLRAGQLDEALAAARGLPGMEGRVAERGLDCFDRGEGAVEEAMLSTLAAQRLRYERGLIVLGTLGNNAPFIGLLGTVLGIVKAFFDLSRDIKGGAAAVMGGISEALVATAIGLLVAIPCVVAYNALRGRVKASVTSSEMLARTILGQLKQAAPTAPDAGTTPRADGGDAD